MKKMLVVFLAFHVSFVNAEANLDRVISFSGNWYIT